MTSSNLETCSSSVGFSFLYAAVTPIIVPTKAVKASIVGLMFNAVNVSLKAANMLPAVMVFVANPTIASPINWNPVAELIAHAFILLAIKASNPFFANVIALVNKAVLIITWPISLLANFNIAIPTSSNPLAKDCSPPSPRISCSNWLRSNSIFFPIVSIAFSFSLIAEPLEL